MNRDRDPRGRRRLLAGYYAATAAFVLLDFVFALNVRLVFLEPWPIWRGLYYLLLLGCLLLILRRPAWTDAIAAAESLVTLAALIIATGARLLPVGDAMIDGIRAAPTLREMLNFVLAGTAAYLALQTHLFRARRLRS